jgi:hypothetical protein
MGSLLYPSPCPTYRVRVLLATPSCFCGCCRRRDLLLPPPSLVDLDSVCSSWTCVYSGTVVAAASKSSKLVMGDAAGMIELSKAVPNDIADSSAGNEVSMLGNSVLRLSAGGMTVELRLPQAAEEGVVARSKLPPCDFGRPRVAMGDSIGDEECGGGGEDSSKKVDPPKETADTEGGPSNVKNEPARLDGVRAPVPGRDRDCEDPTRLPP